VPPRSLPDNASGAKPSQLLLDKSWQEVLDRLELARERTRTGSLNLELHFSQGEIKKAVVSDSLTIS